jgi:hypothetical protein
MFQASCARSTRLSPSATCHIRFVHGHWHWHGHARARAHTLDLSLHVSIPASRCLPVIIIIPPNHPLLVAPQTLRTGDGIGYVVIDIQADDASGIKDALDSMPHSIRTFVLQRGRGYRGEFGNGARAIETPN